MADGNQTKAVMGQALIELCEKQPLTKISVQDIAKQANINRQTFYYHFADKKALVRWIYRTDALVYLTSSDISLEDWEESALKSLKAIKVHEHFYRNVIESQRDVLMEDFLDILHPLFYELFQTIDTDHELTKQDIHFYSRFFSYGCCGMLEDWIRGGFVESPLEIATRLFQLAKDVEFFSYKFYQSEH